MDRGSRSLPRSLSFSVLLPRSPLFCRPPSCPLPPFPRPSFSCPPCHLLRTIAPSTTSSTTDAFDLSSLPMDYASRFYLCSSCATSTPPVLTRYGSISIENPIATCFFTAKRAAFLSKRETVDDKNRSSDDDNDDEPFEIRNENEQLGESSRSWDTRRDRSARTRSAISRERRYLLCTLSFYVL